MKRKLCSLLLALAMLFTLYPSAAFAAETAESAAMLEAETEAAESAAALAADDASTVPERILIDSSEQLYVDSGGVRQVAAQYSGYHNRTETTPLTYDYTMESAALPATGSYYLHLLAYAVMRDGSQTAAGLDEISKVALGLYSDAESFAQAEDLKEVLYGTDASRPGGGYLADFSRGYVDFTVMDVLANIHYLRIQTVAASGGEQNICGENVSWTLSGGVLTIAGSGAMYDYDGETTFAPWFSSVYSITGIVVEDGVTSIGDNAFYGLIAAESVRMGKDVARIGEYAFFSCESLASVEIPEGVQTVGAVAFGYCAGLRDLYLPAAVTSIEYGAFYVCDNLTDIYYSGSAEQLGKIFIDEENDAFYKANIHIVDTPATGCAITSASRGESPDGNGTQVNASVLLDSETVSGMVWCAAYRGGQMMEVLAREVQNPGAASGNPTSWIDTLTFTFETASCDTFKLFLTDGRMKPLASAVTAH